MSSKTFTADFNEALVHQVVTSCLANSHQNTKQQKTRSEVRGGGAKPFRQKGTGRARAGTIRSPIWRGGGRTFAARPGGSTQKINRKMYRAAMCSIVSELIRQERLTVADLQVVNPSTKDAVKLLAQYDAKNVLLITDAFDNNLFLSVRNLSNVALQFVSQVTPVSLLRFEKVLITKAALQQLEGALL